MDVHGIYVRNTLIHSLFHSYFLFFTVLFFPTHGCCNVNLFPGRAGWYSQRNTQVHFSGWLLCFNFLLHSFSAGILICNVRHLKILSRSVTLLKRKFRAILISDKIASKIKPYEILSVRNVHSTVQRSKAASFLYWTSYSWDTTWDK